MGRELNEILAILDGCFAAVCPFARALSMPPCHSWRSASGICMLFLPSGSRTGRSAKGSMTPAHAGLERHLGASNDTSSVSEESQSVEHPSLPASVSSHWHHEPWRQNND